MTAATQGPRGLEKINLKLFASVPPGFDYDCLLAVFGRWRLEQGEEIMDLADYAHVDQGPNCLLVSHRWHFGIDLGGGQPGFFLSVRKGLAGSPEERLLGALQLLLAKTQRLLEEPDVPRTLAPNCGELEVVLNDRLLVPHTPQSFAEWRPVLDRALERLYGKVAPQVRPEPDRGRRVGWRISAPSPLPLKELLGRLG